MVKIKGLPLLTSKNFILERYGQEAYEKIINALSEEDRKIFNGVILSSQFYPLDAYVHWLELEVKLLYNGDKFVLVRQNLEATEKAVKGIYKIFLYLGSPEKVLERLGRINNQLFENLTVQTTKIEKGKVLITVRGYEKKHAIFEILISGFWLTMLKLMGAKDYKFEPRISIADGQDRCEFLLSWTK